MRILTVTHFFEAHGGGIERVAGHLCRQFARLGSAAIWAASGCDEAPAGEIEAVPLTCMNPLERLTGLPMPIPGPRSIGRLAGQIRRSDAVVIHDALYVTSILALLIAKACRKRVVLIQHIAAIPFSSRLLRLVMRIANLLVTRPMLWAADERVFISDTVRRDLLGPKPRRPTQLLFNGVDESIFHPAAGRAMEPPALPAGLGAAPGKRLILFVGRFVEKKGMSVLRALAALRPDLTFLLAGGGPIAPGKWALPNVHDLGPQSSQALADLYRHADLLLLPSVGEGYPLVIQEAMACGLPVVCGEPSNRADPDAAEWICGVAIDLADAPGSARRCADAIDGVAFSREKRAAMARYALRRYNWPAMARDILTLAGRLPERSGGARVAQP